MNKKITVLPGDGIGPEVTRQAIKVLDAVAAKFNHQFQYTYCPLGATAIDQTGNPAPDETLASCLDSDAVFLGAIGDPKYDHDPSAKVRPEQGLLKLRKTLQVFANLRPVTTYEPLRDKTPLKKEMLEGVDMIIFRELTGGTYFGKKGTDDAKTWAFDECRYSREEIERIAHPAFREAQKRRKKLTLIDKANVLETSRLWRLIVGELAPQYPDVVVDYMYVDNAAMQLLLNPSRFDVILTENMFGDILSDEASVLAGSIGLLPSASVGNAYALFEPIHGSYPQAAGKNIANPVGAILSAAMMLSYFDLNEEAALVREAVEWSVNNGIFPVDIDPNSSYTTTAIGDLISGYISGNTPDAVMNGYNKMVGQSTII